MKPFMQIITCALILTIYFEIRVKGLPALQDYKETSRIKRTVNKCGSSLELPYCDVNKPVQFSVRQLNKLKAKFTPGTECDVVRIQFDWIILLSNETDLKFEDYYNKETFIINPYMIGSGNHHVILYLTEYERNGNLEQATADCAFIVRTELPIPQITGGAKITVDSGYDFKVSGESSIDMNVPPGAKGNLQYKWKCEVSGTQSSDFCQKNLGSASFITLPGSQALDGSTYTFTLSVRTNESDWQDTTQTVKFEKKVSALRIICLKNCLPRVLKTNSKNPLILQVVCEKNCLKVRPHLYEWSISDPNFDYASNSKSGRNSIIFHLKANVLQVGAKYEITVSLTGGLIGSSSVEIEIHAPPKLKSCSLIPTSGEALKTKFVVDCDYEEGAYMFEIYSLKNNLAVLLDKGVKPNELTFMLGPGSKVKVKMIDDYRFYDEKVLDATVTTSLTDTNDNDKLDEEIRRKYFDESSENSIENLMASRKYDEALQAINSLTDELANAKKTKGTESVVQKYYAKILQLLDKMPADTDNQAKQLGSSAARVVDGPVAQPPPEIAALVTGLCKTSAEKYQASLKAEPFPESFSAEAEDNARMLSSCSQASTTPNLEIMQVEDTISVPSTPFPLLDVPAITENYPDYEDDPKVSKYKTQFAESSQNLIDICYINSKNLELTMVSEEATKVVSSEFFSVTATKKIGSEMLNTEIKSQDIELVTSKDFIDVKGEILVLMCTSIRNPFWWIQKEEVLTSVAMIQFLVADQIVTSFKEPFLISFGTHDTGGSFIKSYGGNTPRRSNHTLSQIEHDFEKISVHRIDVFEKQGFFVEFVDVTEKDVLDEIHFHNQLMCIFERHPLNQLRACLKSYIQVSITDFYKPSLKEFQKISMQITKGNNIIFKSHQHSYNSWYYLSVLPNSRMGDNSQTAIKFNVYTLSCYRWVSSIKNWEFACGATRRSSVKRISCECYQSSVLSGRITNNEVRKEETLYDEHTLELQASFIIFISVAAVFFLYCAILTCLALNRKRELVEDNAYFLGDVASYYRYGYLLIVKTGNKRNAGTTSNIVIKLYGNESDSKEHVLNYPDPEKKLLQQNQEDWFFMATEQHLGDIVKIDIWSDSIGYRPKWYCTEIEIVDMQDNRYWVFEINKWFEVLADEEPIYTAHPSAEKTKVSKMKFLRNISNAFQGPHMWNIVTYKDRTFSRIKRLTIILSIFVTTYAIGLFLYGRPKMENSDSLAYTNEYGLSVYDFLITVACVVLSFCIHYPIVWFFRRSKRSFAEEPHKDLKSFLLEVNSLCWIALVYIIVLSMTLLIIFGFWVPYITGLLWLTATTASLLVYIFLMENVTKAISNFTRTQKERIKHISQKIKSLLAFIEQQRSMLYRRFGATVLRPFLKPLYTPTDATRIKEQKYWASMREKLHEMVNDIIMITIYVALLYLVILKDKDPMAVVSMAEIEELFGGTHSRSIDISDVETTYDFQEYINRTLITSMQSYQWYGRYITRDPGLTIDNSNKYVGVARLRQHRVRGNSCEVPGEMRYLTEECNPEYSSSPERGDFGEEWKSDDFSDKLARLDHVWDYTPALKAGTLDYDGQLGAYPGGGYVATLGRTMKNSLINLNYLQRTRWIDRLSRCICIEFLVYSPNTNLFNSVRIVLEYSATGYVETNFEVDTARLLSVSEETGLVIWLILISFVVMVLVLTMKMVYKLVKNKTLAFSDTWNFVDIAIICMSFACLLLYTRRAELVKDFLLQIQKARHNEFVNYFHLLHSEATLTVIAAILVFLSTLRLWKLLRFMLIIKILEKTLLLSAPPLLCLFLCQLVIIMAHTFAGILLFGSQSDHFKNVSDSIVTMVLLSLNLHPDFDLEVIYTTIHYIYYSVYMIVTLGIYTLYITIITISYGEAQIFYSNVEEYTVVDYLKEQYIYYSELYKVRYRGIRMRGGYNDESMQKYVYPKDDEHRFADCLTVPSSRMKGMIFVCKCVLRNLIKKGKGETAEITDTDDDLIKKTLVNLFRGESEEKDIFYLSNVEGSKAKLVDDRTFLKMEKVTRVYLEGGLERGAEERRKRYKKIMAAHEKKLKEMGNEIDVILNILSNIDVGGDDEE